MKDSAAASALCILACIAGCKTAGPDYRIPDQAQAQSARAQAGFIDTGLNQATTDQADLPDDWWTLYHDDRLNDLIRQALAANAGLRSAEAHLRKAVAVYDEALHTGGLRFDASADVARAQISGESFLLTEKLPVANIGSAGINASYQTDLFGKLKRGAEAAQDDAQAIQAARDLARITVAAQVARSYLEICHGNRALEITKRSIDVQQRSADVARRLLGAGRGSRIDLARANAQAELLRAGLPSLKSRQSAARYELAALLAHAPGDLPEAVTRCTQAPTLEQPIPVGNGMALLQRRPDIRQAERELAAATARIGVAVASLYPDVQIGASLGSVGVFEDLGSSPTRQWSIGPMLTWTIPASGARARIAATEAGADVALAGFDAVVLNALRGTQTALSNYAQQLDRQSTLQRAQSQAQLASDQAAALYRGGRTPYLSSLDAERTLAEARATAAEADTQVSINQIDLFLALGGGWRSD
ncbi:MAG: Outer rane component of tripartite multidrug resistance system [Hydrocarboniphaga sp.]|uniref:efflux transporter outer membrane subunit n=1 Tax=Hydrocarboniphaga sp. TaxID=2033016 RepID=UPI002619A419|nr:TolC family protein [Hydrocarboniphaga sp.]MDB5971665.1 Outer rane component of tripartite multidrug resistance system [Hydrocarboniphaga sp.]